jgi:outer membrane protein OmpA-like peptidoglycan-associated protein
MHPATKSFHLSSPLCIALALIAGGCQLSVAASGEANTGGVARGGAGEGDTGQAQGQAQGNAAAERARQAAAIRYSGGKLDYQGVINFEYNKADLKADAETEQTLKSLQAFLEQHPEVKIEVQGHTDSRGSDKYNRELSDRRAASVRKWLVDNLIDEQRVTSVGKGEDEPQVPEPEACRNKQPADTSPCEEAWGKNRRVVFRVTAGAEKLEQAAAAPPVEEDEAPPPPEPLSPPEPSSPGCGFLVGGHLNGLGPNSWGGVALAVQPGVCWLEPSIGFGFGMGSFEPYAPLVEDPEYGTISVYDKRYLAFTVPLRARLWFMDTHSVIGDVGLGVTHYRISASFMDDVGNTAKYERNSTPLIANIGAGYGFRPNGSDSGFRLAITGGALIHLTKLGGSWAGGYVVEGAGSYTQQDLDYSTGKLTDLEPYGELSLGMLF